MKRATVLIALICLMPLLILSVIYGPGLYHWMTQTGPKSASAGLTHPETAKLPPPAATSSTSPTPGLPPPPVEGPTLTPEVPHGHEVTKPVTQERNGNTVTVRSGDSLFNIVVRKYGDSSYMNDVLVANPGLNPKRLKIGQKINLPPKEKLDRKTSLSSGRDEPEVWVVKEGDTLISIARAYFGDSDYAVKIYELNRDQMPTRESLRAGMRLRLPPKPF